MNLLAQPKKSFYENMELLVYSVAEQRFGINTARVREIIPLAPVNRVPKAHKYIAGVFEIRDRVLPLVSLRSWLDLGAKKVSSGKVLICSFFDLEIGLWIDDVERIHSVSWDNINAAGIIRNYSPVITGTVKISDRIIAMLDYEGMVLEIAPCIRAANRTEFGWPESAREGMREKRIWLVDDSPKTLEFLSQILAQAGFSDIRTFADGQELIKFMDSDSCRQEEQAEKTCDLLITDLEMPLLDGLTLIQNLRVTGREYFPVILVSSLADPAVKLRSEAAGVEAVLGKGELARLPEVALLLLSKPKSP